MIEFKGFDKIARLSRGCTITEKVDGTNAQIFITDAGEFYIGSRKRWITPEDDNFGFARWAHERKAELMQLGPGQHFGEWWGRGIQRTYGLPEKRFSLFNTSRWCADVQPPPPCCSVVPVLYSGIFTSTAVDDALELLRAGGSVAAPGFMRPEGVVVYQSAGRCYFKKTLEKDEEPKSRNSKSND